MTFESGDEKKFDMHLTREQAIFLMAAGLTETPFWNIMCKEYGEDQREDGDEDWIGLADDDFDTIRDDQRYETFGFWFNRPGFERIWKEQETKEASK